MIIVDNSLPLARYSETVQGRDDELEGLLVKTLNFVEMAAGRELVVCSRYVGSLGFRSGPLLVRRGGEDGLADERGRICGR